MRFGSRSWGGTCSSRWTVSLPGGSSIRAKCPVPFRAEGKTLHVAGEEEEILGIHGREQERAVRH